MRVPVTMIAFVFSAVAGLPDSVSTSPDVQTSLGEPVGDAHAGALGWSGGVPGVIGGVEVDCAKAGVPKAAVRAMTDAVSDSREALSLVIVAESPP